MTYKLPPYILQYSLKTGVDCLGCVSFSLCNMIYMMTGKLYSHRALAKMSATDFVSGNNVATVLNCADEQGLIPYDLWPVPETFTWNEFYAEVPNSALQHAEKLDIVLIPPDLTKSPVWTEFEGLNANTNHLYQHMVAGIGNNEYIDSEPRGQIKNFTGKTIEYRSSIRINNSPNSMNLVENNGTYYVEGDMGYYGINGVDYLNLLLKIVSPAEIQHRQPNGKQLGVVETATSGFVIKPS